MIKELIDTYGSFDDFILNKIEYFFDEDRANIFICCFNKKENKYENIKIELLGIENLYTRNFEYYYGSILVEKRKNNIIFDFDSIDHFDYLEENPDSRFKIICKVITFEVL